MSTQLLAPLSIIALFVALYLYSWHKRRKAERLLRTRLHAYTRYCGKRVRPIKQIDQTAKQPTAYAQPQTWDMFPIECLELLDLDALEPAPTVNARVYIEYPHLPYIAASGRFARITPTTAQPHPATATTPLPALEPIVEAHTTCVAPVSKYSTVPLTLDMIPSEPEPELIGDNYPVFTFDQLIKAWGDAAKEYDAQRWPVQPTPATAITPEPLHGKIRRVPAKHRVSYRPAPERALEASAWTSQGIVEAESNPYITCQVCEYAYRRDDSLDCPMCQSEYDFRDVARLQRELDESLAMAMLTIKPVQADMTREVQFEAELPMQEPAPEPVIEPDIEGIPAHLIHAACNDRTVFEPIALRELAESIESNGLHQAITVRPCTDGSYELVMGERRYRAMTQILGWQTIPQNYVNVRDMTDIEASRAMFEENLKRVDLNPIDEANAYAKRMRDFDLTESQIAAELGFPISRIKSRLALLALAPDIQLLVQGGSLPLGAADCMTKLDSNFQLNALRYYQHKNPTVAEFTAFCSDQLLDQASLAFLDFDEFMTESGAAKERERLARLAKAYPTNPRMPAMPKASSVALAIETYIHTLMQSNDLDLQDAAGIVGSVYQGLLDAGLTKRPKRSPLTPAIAVEVITTPAVAELAIAA